MPDSAIDLQNVVKIYGKRVHALQGISLRVGRGEVFGLLGPNGAGKSTLVKIMMTVVRPTRAVGTILGNPVGHKPTLARVGYLPENHRFPKYLTGRQVLEFFAALAKVDRRKRKERAGELLETVGMAEWANTRISTYSKGMLQRVGLAQALVNDPDLVALDEPTDGVDPVGRREILDVLGRLRGQGKTVFINSHALSELESICDRVAILVKGKVARQGTIDELTVAKQRYEIQIMPDGHPATQRETILGALPARFLEQSTVMPATAAAQPPTLPYVSNMPPSLPQFMPPFPVARRIDRGRLNDTGEVIELDGLLIRIATTDAARVQPLIDALRAAKLTILRVQQVRPSLEDLFLDTVTDAATGRGATPGASLSPIPKGGRP